jgi:molybdate/tungstate transport system substrate-binding protein
MRKPGYKIVMVVLILMSLILPCLVSAEQEKVMVLHAGSLAIPFAAIEKQFEKEYPGIDVLREGGGSTAMARKITDLGQKADIMASADYTVIDELLIPKFAKWNALFAKNSIVIMYNDSSKYASKINTKNWYRILLRKGVKFGHSDPNQDPCGYRTLLTLQLAEKYYKKDGLYAKLRACPGKNVRPKSVDLIALLESGHLDYVFEYKSVALQHKAKYVELPEAIDLSSMKYAEFYKKAQIDVTGKKPGEMLTMVAKPITYGVTLTTVGEHRKAAITFLKFLLDQEKGLKILEDFGQPVICPVEIRGAIKDVPQELKSCF